MFNIQITKCQNYLHDKLFDILQSNDGMLNIKLFDAGHLNDKCPNDMIVECQNNCNMTKSDSSLKSYTSQTGFQGQG